MAGAVLAVRDPLFLGLLEVGLEVLSDPLGLGTTTITTLIITTGICPIIIGIGRITTTVPTVPFLSR